MKKFKELCALKTLVYFLFLALCENNSAINLKKWKKSCEKINSVKKTLEENSIFMGEDQFLLMKLYCYYENKFNRDESLFYVKYINFEGFIKDEDDVQAKTKVIIKLSNNHVPLIKKYKYVNRELLDEKRLCLDKIEIYDKKDEKDDLPNKIAVEEDMESNNIFIKPMVILKANDIKIKIFYRGEFNKNNIVLCEKVKKIELTIEKEIDAFKKLFPDEINDGVVSKILNKFKIDRKKDLRPLEEASYLNILRKLISIHVKSIEKENLFFFGPTNITFDEDYNLKIITDRYMYVNANSEDRNYQPRRTIVVYDGEAYDYIIFEKEERIEYKKFLYDRKNEINHFMLEVFNYLMRKVNEFWLYKKLRDCKNRYMLILSAIDNKYDMVELFNSLNDFLWWSYAQNTRDIYLYKKFSSTKSILSSKNHIFISDCKSILIVNKCTGEKIKLCFSNIDIGYNELDVIYKDQPLKIYVNSEMINTSKLDEADFIELKEKIEIAVNKCHVPDLGNELEDYKNKNFYFFSGKENIIFETCLLFENKKAYHYFILKPHTDINHAELNNFYQGIEIEIKFFKEFQTDVEEIKEEHHDEIINFMGFSKDDSEETINEYITENLYNNISIPKKITLIFLQVLFTYIPFLGIKVMKYDASVKRYKSLYYVSKYEVLIADYEKEGFKKLSSKIFVKKVGNKKLNTDKILILLRVLDYYDHFKILYDGNDNISDALKRLSYSAFENGYTMFKKMKILKKSE